MAVTGDEAENAGGQNPKHDEGYKGILSNSAVFLHFLRKYFAKPWTANISADDIERVDKSFITGEYRHIDSDLIYKLKIDGSDVYFYVLIELQSKVDFTMPFRLLRYMTALLNAIFEDEDEKVRARKGFRLPAIVPIVLYDGKDSWTAAMTYREYTKGYGIFGDNIVDFRYFLFDLNRTDEDAIEPVENPLDAVFVVEKLRIRKKLTADKLMDWWTEKTSGLSSEHKDTLINWINNIYFKGEMPPEIKKTLKNNLKKGGRAMKSLVEEWVDEGVRKGRREGRKREALEIARHLKDLGRMSVDEIAKVTKLTVDDVLRL